MFDCLSLTWLLNVDAMFRVLEGRDMVLVCQAAGIPPPRLTWSLGDLTLDSQDGRLELKDVGRSQEGNYVCTAENKYGQIESQVPLQVELTSDERQDSLLFIPGHTRTTKRKRESGS